MRCMKHLCALLLLCLLLPLRAADIPAGTWTHEDSGLTLSVEPLKGEPDKDLCVVAGKQVLCIYGPAPRAGRADDILILTGSKVTADAITFSGHFTWDSKPHPVEAVLTWKDGKPLLTITKNPGYETYPAGKYPLKKAKR